MPPIIAIPHRDQHQEPWANGAGVTTVILREPDAAAWRVRISVARVDHDGPFSELPDTRRVLVPLDGPMTLRFADNRELHAARMQALQFAGSPAPLGVLPEGPTRDFNLMLRGSAAGEVIARTLVGPMLLPATRGVRWLLYVDSGHAQLPAADGTTVLAPGDAALLPAAGDSAPWHLDGAGEIVLVKLYP